MKKNIKYNNNKRFKRRSLIKSIPQGLKTTPQKFGMGKNFARIDIPYLFENTQSGTMQNAVVQLGSAISTSQEWNNYVKTFKYFRIKVVNIILPPRPAPTNENYLNAKLYLDWTDSSIENITTNDNAKDIPFFSTRTKVYRFVPIRLNMHSYSNNVTYNYNQWMPLTLMSASSPGWIKISSEFTFSFRMEVVVEMRSNETQVSVTTKHVLKGINSSSQEKGNEVKEEEEEKEDILNINEKDEEKEEEEIKEEEEEQEIEKEEIKEKKEQRIKELEDEIKKLKGNVEEAPKNITNSN